MSRPHVGNLKRDILILFLYDTGEYAPKQIARLMRERGFFSVTVRVVRYVVRRRNEIGVEKDGNHES
jgi:hypothetical protein